MDELIEPQESDVQAENSAFADSQKPLAGLDKNRKIAVVVLGFTAILMIIFWGYNLNHKINDPFTYKGVDKGEEVSETASIDMTKDTDNDGLTDSDETNIYNTSPYLEDSDSDGYKDGDEVKNSTNPNCAVGADCVQELVLEKVDTTAGLDSETAAMTEMLANVDVSDVPQSELKAIREAFLEAGYEKDKLDLMTDQQVYQAYLISLQLSSTQDTSSNVTNENSSNVKTNSDTYISTSDAKVIREAYEKAGYDKAKLDQISDEDLIKAYKEAMASYENNQ